MKASLLLLAPSLASAAVPAIFARACGDNCARAVIASAFPNRHGSLDCVSYLKTTVTPATSTVVKTVTVTGPATATDSLTLTTLTTLVVPLTLTELDHQTATEITTITQTSLIPFPLASATSSAPVFSISLTAVPDKRQATSAPSEIPAYASACSGAARYTTACACVGVVPTTVTAAAPLTTSTVYVSVFEAVTTVSITASTETAVTTTTSNETQTVTTTDATATATATSGTVVLLEAFHVRVRDGSNNGAYIRHMNDRTATLYYSLLDFTADLDSAATFTFGPTSLGATSGTLYAYDAGFAELLPLLATTTPGGNYAYPILMSRDNIEANPWYADNYAPAGCRVSDGLLVCEETQAPSFDKWQAGYCAVYLSDGNQPRQGEDIITLEVVPVVV